MIKYDILINQFKFNQTLNLKKEKKMFRCEVCDQLTQGQPILRVAEERPVEYRHYIKKNGNGNGFRSYPPSLDKVTSGKEISRQVACCPACAHLVSPRISDQPPKRVEHVRVVQMHY